MFEKTVDGGTLRVKPREIKASEKSIATLSSMSSGPDGLSSGTDVLPKSKEEGKKPKSDTVLGKGTAPKPSGAPSGGVHGKKSSLEEKGGADDMTIELGKPNSRAPPGGVYRCTEGHLDVYDCDDGT